MGSKQESLNKRIRETVAGLSDEELADKLRADTQNYTAFARQVWEEELTRRKRANVTSEDARQPDTVVLSSLGEGPSPDKHGCYLEVWSDRKYEGEYFRIEGPGEYQALEFGSLIWSDSISSLRVGPSAFVLVYSEREFKGKMLTLGPNQEVPNLNELRFENEADSIKLVNSLRIFEEFRSEPANKPRATQEQKKKAGRRKGRRGRSKNPVTRADRLSAL